MEAPRIPSLFRIRRARQFNYRPWFYDEGKEERKRRNALIKAGNIPVTGTSESEGRILFSRNHSHSFSRQKKKSNIRVLIILASLLLAAYYLLK